MAEPQVESPRYKIAFVAHSPEVCELVQRAALAFNCDIHSHIPDLDNTILEAQNLLAQGYEVIIYHGNAHHPVIQALGGAGAPLERTHMDIIRALVAAREISRRVVLTSHIGEVHDVEMLSSLLDMQLHLALYDTWDELRNCIESAYAEGYRVSVGGGMTRQFMEQCGGKSIIVAPSETNVHSAIRQALSLARNRRIETAMRNDLLTVLKYMEDGVVCVDTDKKVLFSNQAARQLLADVPGDQEKKLHRYFSELQLEKVLAGEEPGPGKLVTIGNKQFLVDAFPIFTHGVRKGAVALFRDVESLQNISRKIGAALYKRGFIARYTCEDIKGKGMRGVVHKIKRYGNSSASVLIMGATGPSKSTARVNPEKVPSGIVSCAS